MAILVTFCRNNRFIAYSSDIRNVSVIIILIVYFPFYFPLKHKNMEVMRKELKIITPISRRRSQMVILYGMLRFSVQKLFETPPRSESHGSASLERKTMSSYLNMKEKRTANITFQALPRACDNQLLSRLYLQKYYSPPPSYESAVWIVGR